MGWEERRAGEEGGGESVPCEPDRLCWSLSQSQAGMGREVLVPRSLSMSRTLRLLAMKVRKMSMAEVSLPCFQIP